MNTPSLPVSVAASAYASQPRTLRLAVFGHVKDGSASVSSAHFQLCGALLDAGHHLDLYGVPSFVPDPGYDSPHFRYVPVTVTTRIEGDFKCLSANLRVFVHRMAGRRRSHRFREKAMSAARSLHALKPYDAVLFLGIPPGSTIAGVPTVVWPQCAPQNELLAVRGLSEPIARLSGRGAYLQLRLYYEIKDRLVWRWAYRHYLILASNAAREQAVGFGIPPDRVCVTPYPIDLQRFAPSEIPSTDVRRILCLGRLDPRKRIDLLVDAIAVLARRRNDFTVEVIGPSGYAKGWSAFVEKAGDRLPITYSDSVPQAEIVKRLHMADVLVQPSEHEEFGHAVAEALACGVPVVTGPTNATREYVPRAGSAAFHHYTPESLAHAIERALSISRDESARAACRASAQAFASDRVAATLADFIRGIPCRDAGTCEPTRRIGS